MKIAIVCYPTYGGSGVVATELGKFLAERGHEIHFVSYAIPSRLSAFVDNIYYHEVEMYNYPLFEFPLYSIELASKLVEVAKFNDIDIVHAHYAIPHATSAYLMREILKSEGYTKKVKVITTLHGTDITLVGLEPSFLPTMKFTIEQSDGVTAVSKFLKDKTITSYKINKDIEVIPNFIDTKTFNKSSCPDLAKNKSKMAEGDYKILIHISNFRALKRVQDVIRIFDLVKEKVPSKLLLVGDGPERGDCEKLVRELGISHLVKFMGKQDSVAEILSLSDLFLIPSQSESFGLAALEAMSCGLPVISSSIGGLPELNIHGETGYIAEFGDIERMAKYSIDLLTNQKKYNIFSDNARKRALEFDKENIIPLYENFYRKILEQ